jgi:hypothetical protein
MPELLALLACEKVLIDENRNPTLVVIMEKVEATIPAGQQLPANVLAPQPWVIFTMWKRKEGEQPGHCKQLIEIVPPGDSSPKLTSEAEFDFTEIIHKVTSRVNGMPVGNAGICWINVKLQSAVGLTETFPYPLQIVHNYVPAAEMPQGMMAP